MFWTRPSAIQPAVLFDLLINNQDRVFGILQVVDDVSIVLTESVLFLKEFCAYIISFVKSSLDHFFIYLRFKFGIFRSIFIDLHLDILCVLSKFVRAALLVFPSLYFPL